MHCAPLICLSRFVAAVVSASLVSLARTSAVAGDRAPVREQVQFSSPSTPLPSPTARPRADLPPKAFEFLDGDNSISGVVAPFVAPSSSSFPTMPRNARLLEAIDQKKNWVYVRSDEVNRSQSVEEMFGVRDANAAEQKPKTALENFFEDRGQRPVRDRGRNPAEEWNRPDPKKNRYSGFDRDGGWSTNASPQFGNRLDSSRTLTAGFALPSNLLGIAPGEERSDNLHRAGPGDSVSSVWGGKSSPDEFRRLLAVPGSLNPLASGLDSLDLQADTRRQEFNPLAAQRVGAPPVTGSDALDPLRSLATPAGSHSSLLEGPNASALGPSSLSPAVSAPAGAPFTQPKPTVLEFPRRKF